MPCISFILALKIQLYQDCISKDVGKMNSIVLMYVPFNYLVVPQFLIIFFQELGKQWIYFMYNLPKPLREQSMCTPYYTI